MLVKNTAQRYGIITILFHWGMALLILGMLALGLYMTGLSISAEKLKLYGWHKALGVIVLILALMRILWRWMNTLPLLPNSIPHWQQQAAHTMHFILYGFMLFMPLTGWLMSSAAGLPVSVFGIFILPDLIAPNPAWHTLFREIHEWLAYSLIVAIALHTMAALKHQFINKDEVLRRMFL